MYLFYERGEISLLVPCAATHKPDVRGLLERALNDIQGHVDVGAVLVSIENPTAPCVPSTSLRGVRHNIFQILTLIHFLFTTQPSTQAHT